MRATTLSALVLGSVLVLTGCGDTGAQATATTSASSETVTETPTEPTGKAPKAATEPVQVAKTLRFSATALDGSSFEGASLAGKPAVLWFWAPWCSTCRAQAGGVSDLAERFRGEVNVVGVGGLAEASDIRDFAGEVAGPTHLIDDPGAVWRHFGVTAQSTYVVLDASGKVVEQGYLDDDALADEVERLVG